MVNCIKKIYIKKIYLSVVEENLHEGVYGLKISKK